MPPCLPILGSRILRAVPRGSTNKSVFWLTVAGNKKPNLGLPDQGRAGCRGVMGPLAPLHPLVGSTVGSADRSGVRATCNLTLRGPGRQLRLASNSLRVCNDSSLAPGLVPSSMLDSVSSLKNWSFLMEPIPISILALIIHTADLPCCLGRRFMPAAWNGLWEILVD